MRKHSSERLSNLPKVTQLLAGGASAAPASPRAVAGTLAWSGGSWEVLPCVSFTVQHVQEFFVGHLSAPQSSKQERGASVRSRGSVWIFVLWRLG